MIENPGTKYSTQGGDLDSYKVVLGLKAGWNIGSGWGVNGEILGELGDNHDRLSVNIGFKYTW